MARGGEAAGVEEGNLCSGASRDFLINLYANCARVPGLPSRPVRPSLPRTTSTWTGVGTMRPGTAQPDVPHPGCRVAEIKSLPTPQLQTSQAPAQPRP